MSDSILDRMPENPAPWLDGGGPESFAVLSSRIRLARNLQEFPFPSAAGADTREKLIEFVSAAFSKVDDLKNGAFIRSTEITPLNRRLLVERHLISPEFMREGTGRGLYVTDNEKISIMLNEEDHIRIQVISSGMSLHECWEKANGLDTALGELLEFGFDDTFGYLTSCPTNAGTGLRASVLIHLPGLALADEIKEVLGSISKVGLMVRGFYGEGTDVLGNLFQISNQTTLGRTEDEIIDSLVKVSSQILEYEKLAQEKLMRDAPEMIEDKVWRSYGILKNARVLTSNEVMNLLSFLRMGLSLGLIDKIQFKEINELMLMSQPAHLQRYVGREMDNNERDMARAAFVRERLGNSN